MEVQGYERYMIYEDGRVWSKIGKGKFLKPGVNNKGYYYVNLSNDEKKQSLTIHRLIALHYIPNPENKAEVDHFDRNPLNNDIENLRWTTHAENNCNRNAYGAIKFKGVSKHRNRFNASTTINGKKKHIGHYDTPEEASAAYNNYVSKIKLS